MTVPAIGQTSQQAWKPLLSLGMVKLGRRLGVPIDRLVANGTPADQDAALMNIINDGSQRVNDLALQVVTATLDTMVGQTYVNPMGYTHIVPRYWPALAVTRVSLGAFPGQLQDLASLAAVQVQPQRISVPVSPFSPLTSSQGPIQFGAVAAPMNGAWYEMDVVNGYPHAFLTAPADAGATSIDLDDTTGVIEGRTTLTIYAGRAQFTFTAGAVSNAVNGLGFGPGSVVCPALPYDVTNSEAYPTLVSAMPGALLEAARLVVRSLVKTSSMGNVSATTVTGSAASARDPLGAGDDMAAAEAMIGPYQAVVA